MSNNIECTHCNLSFPKEVMIEEENDLYFCCKGCQGVYHLLKDDGLDSFYDKKGNEKLSAPLAVDEDASNFDLDSFRQVYIKTTPDGFSSIDLVIEGIHCSACIWLNEKILNDEEGILEANINFSNHKAKIVWDEDTIKLSHIIERIRAIGYNAYPYKTGVKNDANISKKRDYFSKLSVAIFASMNIMMIDVGKYTGYLTSMSDDYKFMISIAELIFATPVLFYSGLVFFKGAYFGLKNKIINMDFLVSFGAVLTYIYSLYVLYSGHGHSYFDSVAMIITFVLVGKYLEVIGKKNANDTIDTIKSSIPYEATRIIENEKEIVSVDQIQIGDLIEVKNGQKACVDGKLVSSYASFDQSSISGESIDVVKHKGDIIYSSTINTSDVIVYEATTTYANSTFNSIIELLENSLNTKPKIQDITNELSKNFSLMILMLSLATFTGWYIYNGDFENALIVAISVIVIACPCALALATPIASLIGISWMSQKGLLLKDAKLIEMFNEIDTIVLDKTGTITNAKLEVVNVSNKDLTKEQLNILYTLADSSTHLVSMAVKNYLIKNYDNLEFVTLENITQIAGVGIDAKYNNHTIYGGKSQDISSKYTSFEFKIDNKTIVKFDLQDTIKDDAQELVKFFNEQNVDVIICSGDNEEVVKDVANTLNIQNYKANMKPQDKYDFIVKLKEEGKKVAMVGDGVNDTLALSKADISISMASGSDISINVSDVIILNNSLKSLINSFYISKRTYKFIKQNLFISLIYNLITIPIAMAGYVVPLFAALSMSLSSLLVVGNSFRIKKDIK